MFAARQDDNGVFRICIRRGRAIDCFYDKMGKRQEIQFTSRAKAKACADDLNENYLKEYDKMVSREGVFIGDLEDWRVINTMVDILDTIEKYTTLNRE